MIEELFKTYVKEICSKCKNKKYCQEELHIREDNTIKCNTYKRKDNTKVKTLVLSKQRQKH